MTKLEWLNWATEQGLLKVLDWGDIVEWEACNEDRNVVAFQLKDKPLELRNILEFAIRDEIDKRGLLLRQLDIKVYSDKECTQYEGREHRVIISKLTSVEENGVIGSGESKDSRLEALCEAFKEAVTSAN